MYSRVSASYAGSLLRGLRVIQTTRSFTEDVQNTD